MFCCHVAIAEALNSKIFVRRDKKQILDCLDDALLCQRLTVDMKQAGVHVVNMAQLNIQVTGIPRICIDYRLLLLACIVHNKAFISTSHLF